MAFAMLLASGCQYEYPMVAPPKPGQYTGDSLEDEDGGGAISGNVYYVSVAGDGDMDGLSWDSALDVEGLRVLLTDNTNLSSATICVAEGEYLIGREAGPGLNINKNIKAVIGGFCASSTGTDLEKHDPSQYRTVFSGDINQNKIADEGDCFLFSVTGGNVRFEDITFEYGYIDDNYSSLNDQAAGPVFGIKGAPSTTSVEVVGCTFINNKSIARNNQSMNGHSTQAGGTCALVSAGYFKARDCRFENNVSTSRGGAVRGLNDNAIMFFDRCSFVGNKLTDSGNVFGSCIQLTGGCVLLNNCTMSGNTGSGGELNGGGAFLVVNTTIINWANDSYGAFRCESKAKSDTKFINNAFLSEKENGVGFVYQGTNHDITSAGYNLMAGYTGSDIKKPTDVVYGTMTGGSVNDKGCYVWDQTKVPVITTFAKVADVISVANSFNPTYNSDVYNLGTAFVNWVGEEGFAVDQMGNQRNPEKLQRGSYDAGLK